MKVVSVTVNFKTPEMTTSAIRSELSDIHNLGGRIFVIDNDSNDGSFEKISRSIEANAWGETVRVVNAPRNGGFGYGNNLGFRLALDEGLDPEYFYLLGPDASIPPGSLTRLVEFMDRNPQVGLAGNKTFNPDGSERNSSFRFPGIISEFEQGLRLGVISRLLAPWTVRMPVPQETTPVDWVSAASLIIRKDVLQQVQMFDESFFLYFEETDLCKRCRSIGWPTYYVVESTVTHVGQVSTKMNDLHMRRPSYWFDSRRLYFLKHHGVLRLWLANTVFILSRLLWQVRRLVQKKPVRDPPHFLQDFIRHSFLPVTVPPARLDTSRQSYGAPGPRKG